MIEREIIHYFLNNWYDMSREEIRDYLLAVANNEQETLYDFVKGKKVLHA